MRAPECSNYDPMEGHRDLCLGTRAPEYQISPMDAYRGLCLAKFNVSLPQGADKQMPG